MGLIGAVAILAIDNRFSTPSLGLKCLGTSLGTSLGGAKQKFSIPLGLNMAAVWLRSIEMKKLLKVICDLQKLQEDNKIATQACFDFLQNLRVIIS